MIRNTVVSHTELMQYSRKMPFSRNCIKCMNPSMYVEVALWKAEQQMLTEEREVVKLFQSSMAISAPKRRNATQQNEMIRNTVVSHTELMQYSR